MKKIFAVLAIFILVGCGQLDNTPNKQVEAFFNNYQMLSTKVVTDLTNTTSNDTSLTSEQKREYIEIMKKHYQDLTYEIKDDTINGNNATVEVEITVKDNAKVLRETEEYRVNNVEIFNDENGNFDQTKYKDYQIKLLKENKTTITYTINLGLTKNNGNWELNQVASSELDKINGIY